MNNRLKAALYFGVGLTFTFCIKSFIDVLKGVDNTSGEIIRSFGAALIAGLAAGLLTYFFIGQSNADKMFGKKEE